MRLPEAVIEALLDAHPVARLATLGREGRPHLVPVVFARVGARLWSPVDAKPKAASELARVRNALANPAVSLLLDEYGPDWERLWWLRVDGEARVVRPSDPECDPEVSVAVAALRRKYPQYATRPVLRDPPTLLCVLPRRIASWCAGPAALP